MHEHGLVDRIVTAARAEAERQGGALRAVRVRLGAMASLSEPALRRDFDHIVREHLGLDVALEVELAPDRPSGVEIVAVEIAR